MNRQGISKASAPGSLGRRGRLALALLAGACTALTTTGAPGCAAGPLPTAAVPGSPVERPAGTPAPLAAASPGAPALTLAAVTPSATPTPPVAAPTTPDAPFRAQAPAAGPEPVFHVPPFTRFKLKNGAEVILAEFHDLPLVEVHLVLKTGGGANPAGEAGLADLTANMLDEGTKTRSALQIAEQVGSLGGALTTSSSWDGSVVTLSSIARNFEAALAIWSDVIVHPAFTDKELARVRENLLTAVTRRKDSPPTLANLLLTRVLFGEKHPYGWPLTGVEETLRKISAADIRRFYATYYHPSNATIIAAGDITEPVLRAKLEAALHDWRPARAPAVRVPAPAALTGKRIYLIDKPGAPQSSIRVGFLGVRRTDPDYFAILMMNQILGGAFYRLDMNLREHQQWTYGARSSFEMRRTPGPASAGGEFVAPHTADAVAEILKEMRTIATTEVTDEELGRAKDNFVRSFPARFATRASTAAQLGELAVYGLPNSFLEDYTKKIQAVTKAEILRAAQRFLSGDRLAIIVVGDRASQEVALRKLAPLEIRDLDGAPLAATPSPKDVGPRPGATN
jgi:zinc protease